MGPLAGRRIIEVAGLGAGPYAGMLLADMGADVIRVERMPLLPLKSPLPDPLARSRRSIALNLKHPDGVEALLRLVEGADALFEGYRPGVAERLGFGPADCHARNPGLVYGRVTGWGQDGPLAGAAGHDLNYIALSGALHAIGAPGGKPVPPLNLVGDFGGGGLLLAFGIVCALLERERSGQGQVVDAAMLDGAVSFMAMFMGFRSMGMFRDETGSNVLGGAAHFYDTYETADGRFVAIAALEPAFYALLIERAGLDPAVFEGHGFRLGQPADEASWPRLKAVLADVVRQRTRDEWCELLEGTDACFAPVLGLSEAPAHPHNLARGTFTEVAGQVQNAPAPRFDRTPPGPPRPARPQGADGREVLAEAGYSEAEIVALADAGALELGRGEA